MQRKKDKSVGILLSGGLDSAALVGWFLNREFNVYPIYISAGLRWEKTELEWAHKFLKAAARPRLKKLAIIPLDLAGAYDSNWSQRGQTPGARSLDKSVFLPGRNLLLVVTACLHLYSKGISRLALATLQGNPFRDARPAYFKAVGKILSDSFSKQVSIMTPFRNMEKKDVIKLNQMWPIELSFSCINPKGIFHCGRCNKCAERKKAFKLAGVRDLTRYALG
jgi:7-cyano-7-deazaguanine synthase